MNPGIHKAPPARVEIAIAECRHYLPDLACFAFASLALLVASGLNIYQ
jgi:hypothetical protein